MSRTLIQQVSGGLLHRRWLTWALAALLIAFSVGLAWQREQMKVVEQSREVSVQASILAGSVAGALAFDDTVTVKEYVNALKFDQSILSAGIYNADGGLVAGFAKDGRQLPSAVSKHPPQIKGLQLTVVEPRGKGIPPQKSPFSGPLAKRHAALCYRECVTVARAIRLSSMNPAG